MTASTVRTITDDELEDFINVVHVAFVSPKATADDVEVQRPTIDVDRCHAAFDDSGKLCGTARAFATELTVPGGHVAAGGVSSVGVLPTHRRRGHLTRLMKAQLDDIAERGEPVAILVAAEYPIYGRFGYGMAVEACELRIDADAGRWLGDATGRTELVDNDTFAKVLTQVYDRVRVANPGHIRYEDGRWDVLAGIRAWPDGDDKARRDAAKVVWSDDEGAPQAVAAYSVDGHWEHNRPAGTLSTTPLVATSGRAELEMLRFLTAVDWVGEVRVGLRPVDDPAPLALADGRAAQLVGRSDHVWVRILDVPAALGARRYPVPGTLTVEVADPAGYASGRFRLEVDGEGTASCTSTDAAPDLVAPVAALGAAYVGGVSWARLAAGGWVDEHQPGAVARASGMFGWPRAPFCAMTF